MKKTILLTLALLLFIVPVSFAEEDAPVSKFRSILKISVDTMGNLEISEAGSSAKFDVDTGFSVSSEFSKSINTNLDVGAGLTVQMPRSITDAITDASWYYIPIYGLVRAFPSPETPLYVTGQLGFNFFNGNVSGIDYSGGLYTGVGVGYLSDKLLVELLYSKNSGQVSFSGYGSEGDFDYSKVSLSAGLVF